MMMKLEVVATLRGQGESQGSVGGSSPRLGWLDRQRPRVIDRPVPELVVQLLET